MKTEVKLNPDTTAELQAAIRQVIQADNRREKAADNVLAKTESIVLVAIAIGTLADWDAYRAEIDRLCRLSKKTARALGYIQKEVSIKGSATLRVVPRQTLANIFSVIRQSLKYSVPLKDGRGAPRTFNAIKSEKDKAATKARKATRTDRQKDVQAIADMFQSCLTNLKNVDSDADVSALRARIKAEVLPMFPTATAVTAKAA